MLLDHEELLISWVLHTALQDFYKSSCNLSHVNKLVCVTGKEKKYIKAMKPKVGKVSSFLQFLEMGYSHIPVCFIFFILT